MRLATSLLNRVQLNRCIVWILTRLLQLCSIFRFCHRFLDFWSFLDFQYWTVWEPLFISGSWIIISCHCQRHMAIWILNLDDMMIDRNHMIYYDIFAYVIFEWFSVFLHYVQSNLSFQISFNAEFFSSWKSIFFVLFNLSSDYWVDLWVFAESGVKFDSLAKTSLVPSRVWWLWWWGCIRRLALRN